MKGMFLAGIAICLACVAAAAQAPPPPQSQPGTATQIGEKIDRGSIKLAPNSAKLGRRSASRSKKWAFKAAFMAGCIGTRPSKTRPSTSTFATARSWS